MGRRPWHKPKRKKTPEEIKSEVAALVERLHEHAAKALPGEHRRTPCRITGCLCTHDAPCEAGWIEVDYGVNAGNVIACGQCRSGVRAQQLVITDRAEFQAKIRDVDAREEARNATAWDD